MSLDDAIDARRKIIDAIDLELVELVARRARMAQEIGDMKQGDGFRPGREAEVLRRAMAANPGPLDDDQVARIMREVMSACLRLETPLGVAYLGPAGTYTEAALYRFFGHGVKAVPADTVEDILRTVTARDAEYGVVPIENSSEGAVHHTMDALVDASVRICGEVTMPIHHHLLAKEGTNLEEIQVVRAHAHALAQCRSWLETHLPDARREAVNSNAEAARRAGPGEGAIASAVAAELHDLKIIASRVEDRPDNATRFLVVGDRLVPPTGLDKTTLVAAAGDGPGALVALLKPFEECGVNMTRIESRPSRRQPWDYQFFIDIEGHEQDAPVQQLLAALRETAAYVKVLGSYPRAIV